MHMHTIKIQHLIFAAIDPNCHKERKQKPRPTCFFFFLLIIRARETVFDFTRESNGENVRFEGGI